MQRDLQKAKWRKTSNQRRREQYAKNPDYRKKVLTRSREHARAVRGGDLVDRSAVCFRSLQTLYDHGASRGLVGSADAIHCYTSAELAPMLGLSSVVILHGWQRDERFPKPELPAHVGRTHAQVYTVPQVKQFLAIMAEHFKRKNYLNGKDLAVIQALRDAMTTG